jgi:hypothetical protein
MRCKRSVITVSSLRPQPAVDTLLRGMPLTSPRRSSWPSRTSTCLQFAVDDECPEGVGTLEYNLCEPDFR